jgi:hypothetical protein
MLDPVPHILAIECGIYFAASRIPEIATSHTVDAMAFSLGALRSPDDKLRLELLVSGVVLHTGLGD